MYKPFSNGFMTHFTMFYPPETPRDSPIVRGTRMGSSSSAGAASKELASKTTRGWLKLLETHWFSMAKTMGTKKTKHGKNM